jgi:hypothetical protein
MYKDWPEYGTIVLKYHSNKRIQCMSKKFMNDRKENTLYGIYVFHAVESKVVSCRYFLYTIAAFMIDHLLLSS